MGYLLKRQEAFMGRQLGKWIGILGGICVFIIFLSWIPEKNEAYSELSAGISRGRMAKSLALAFVDKDVCINIETSFFSEKEDDKWYVPYMNYLYSCGYISTVWMPPDQKTAEGRLTQKEWATILQNIGMGNLVLNSTIEKEVSFEQFWKDYQVILEKTDPNRIITRKTITLYQTAANLADAKPWEAYTDIGVLGFDGIALDYYLGKQILVSLKGNEIIRVFGEEDPIPVEEPETVQLQPIEQAQDIGQEIRVLIQASDYSQKLHNMVNITSSEGFHTICGEAVVSYAAGETITVTPEQLLAGSMLIEPDGNAELTISSIHRAQGTPSYPGRLELTVQGNQIAVINIVEVEEYLTRVVPSEMPASYGVEAAKVQAICARTYAWQKLVSGQCPEYGAHVDDSTNYQVYNAISKQEVSTEGVNATAGLILTSQGNIITPYYFSTSCGYTADNQIWGGNVESYPYLASKAVSDLQENLNLTDEATFQAFILNKEYPAYEIAFPWYRWEYSIDLKALEEMIKGRLPSLMANRPHTTLAVQADGTLCEASDADIGTLISVEVLSRYTGGIAAQLKITGTKQTIMIQQESSIRAILGSPNQMYQNKSESGSGKSEGNYLPSAFVCFVPIMECDVLTGYRICGGGNGHGIGMSQNGVYAMTMQGKGWEEIIHYFYSSIEVKKLSELL